MRKIITFILALVLIVSMTVTTFAATPKFEYKPVRLPQIKPDTSFVQDAVSKWFKTNPIDLPDINISYISPTLN